MGIIIYDLTKINFAMIFDVRCSWFDVRKPNIEPRTFDIEYRITDIEIWKDAKTFLIFVSI